MNGVFLSENQVSREERKGSEFHTQVVKWKRHGLWYKPTQFRSCSIACELCVLGKSPDLSEPHFFHQQRDNEIIRIR